MPTAFVTGGSGFIGGAFVRRLVADGVGVRALARSDASVRAVRDAGAQPVPGDLGDRRVEAQRRAWGPGETTIPPPLVEAVRRGRFAWVGGVRHRTATTLRRVAGALAAAAEAAWCALPLPGRPPLTRLAVWLSGRQATIDISGARKEVGDAPVRTVDEGLAELAEEEGRGEQR